MGRRLRRNEKPRRASDESKHLQANATDPVGEQNGRDNADQEQQVDEGRALGCDQVVADDIGDAQRVRPLIADRRGEDGRRKNADAIGSEILETTRAPRKEQWRAGY